MLIPLLIAMIIIILIGNSTGPSGILYISIVAISGMVWAVMKFVI